MEDPVRSIVAWGAPDLLNSRLIGVRAISRRFWLYGPFLFAILRATAAGACRDCAQMAFGGPEDNRYTAFDTLCRGDACANQGYAQVSVNLANLTLYIRVTDLALGGPGGAFRLERSYNSDNQQAGPFGVGWSFSLGDTLTADSDGTITLQRGSGRTDVFAPAFGGASYFAVTGTADSLAANANGGYTLTGTGGVRVFNAAGKLTAVQSAGATIVALTYDSNGNLTTAAYRTRTLNFTNDGAGHITGFSDSTGRGVSFSYTSDGHLAQQTNVDGTNIGYQYDGSGDLTAVVYPGGTLAVAWLTDPPFVSVSSVTTPDGAVRKYATPLSPTQVQLTDAAASSRSILPAPPAFCSPSRTVITPRFPMPTIPRAAAPARQTRSVTPRPSPTMPTTI